MKFLIVDHPPLSIRIPLGTKHSPQNPVFKYLSPHSTLNARDLFSQPYSITSNINVVYVFIFKLFERSRKDKSVWTE